MGLDSVEIVLEAERLFNIELPDEVVERVFTFREFVDCVQSACQQRGYDIAQNEIISTLRKAVAEQLGLAEKDIELESRFVEDLGMD